MEREQAYRNQEMQGYKEMDRDMQSLRNDMPRVTNLALADGIVSDLLSNTHSQFKEFVPRDVGALNYVRGEANKNPGRNSPPPRPPFRPTDDVRMPHGLMSPSTFEP
jgi:hypothetical protein